MTRHVRLRFFKVNQRSIIHLGESSEFPSRLFKNKKNVVTVLKSNHFTRNFTSSSFSNQQNTKNAFINTSENPPICSVFVLHLFSEGPIKGSSRTNLNGEENLVYIAQQIDTRSSRYCMLCGGTSVATCW